MTRLTHLDPTGAARMVDVSDKAVTRRSARAEGRVVMEPETLRLIRAGDARKGDVLGTARLAGIMAAKRTHELIPLCHSLALSKISVDCVLDDALPGVRVTAEATLSGQTGVEMEALTAVSIACLTVYDMVKAADRAMRIEGIRLLHKSGGRSGVYEAGQGAAGEVRRT
jgi:cyclic pyranopterin monophosphate synthase